MERAPPHPEWLAGLRRGDGPTFDAVYARYRPGLFAYLARMSGRREAAEDLLQETWLRLARHAPSLAPGTDVGAWLFTVATNALRSQQRWHVVDLEKLRQALFVPRAEQATPFEALATTQAHRVLERGLAALSSGDREVMLLVGVEGMTPTEAAGVLGLKPEALRQRLSRARARLVTHLEATESISALGGLR